MEDTKKKQTEKKPSETFEILFEELTTLLIMSGKDFFKKFENTLKSRIEFGDLVGILVSAHISSLNFWFEKLIAGHGTEEIKTTLRTLISAVETALSSIDGAYIIKNKAENG